MCRQMSLRLFSIIVINIIIVVISAFAGCVPESFKLTELSTLLDIQMS